MVGLVGDVDIPLPFLFGFLLSFKCLRSDARSLQTCRLHCMVWHGMALKSNISLYPQNEIF